MPSSNTNRCRVHLRSERGQALLELALVLPVLLGIIFGGIYLSQYFNWSNDATQLAGEGARLAAVNSVPASAGSCTSTNLTTYLKCRAGDQSNGFKDHVSSVCVSYPTGPTGTTKQIGDPVTVTVTVDYPSIKLPLGAGHFDIAKPKTKSATMRIEQAQGATIAAVC